MIQAKRNVVISSVGLSPKAVGEGLWALERLRGVRIDRHVRILTTKAKQKEQEIHPPYLDGLPGHEGEWHTEPRDLECDDVTRSEMRRVRDRIVEIFRDLRQEEPDAVFYLDVTPGRVTVSYALAVAAQLYAYPEDRLLYALPAASATYLTAPGDPQFWPKQESDIDLFEMPLLRLRTVPALLQSHFFPPQASVSEMLDKLDEGTRLFEHLVLLGLHAHGTMHDTRGLLASADAAIQAGDTTLARSLLRGITEAQESYWYLARKAGLPVRNLLRGHLQPTEVGLRDFVGQRFEELRGLGLSLPDLVNEVPDELRLRVRPTLLSRTLGNLLKNAVRALGGGGTVTVRASLHEELVELTVTDTGPGFPPGQLGHLFDFFKPRAWQAEARASVGDGLGLGLPITRELARELAGPAFPEPLRVENLPAGGARIHLLLPRDGPLEEDPDGL